MIARDEILVGQNALAEIDVDAELLVELVATDATEIVFLRIEKEPLQQSARIRNRGRIARAQLAIDILERFLLVVRRIFLQRFHDGVVVRDVDHLHFLVTERHDLADRRQGERLKSARHGHFAVEHVGDQNFGRELLFVELLAQLQVFDRVEKLDHFLVRAVAEGAQESGGEKFPPAFAAIEIDVKQIAGVELHFDPGAAIRNDPEAVEHLAVEVNARLESDARGAMQLRNDDALGAVDHKRALRRHERDFAHVNLLLLRPLLFLELEGDVERRAESLAFALRLERAQFRLADFVMAEIELGLFVVALDRENFLENGLQAGVLALARGNIFLQEIDVGIELNLDQIRRLDRLLDGSEMDALCGTF